jgi:phenylalanyl-tRNA synthetase beta subunit
MHCRISELPEILQQYSIGRIKPYPQLKLNETEKNINDYAGVEIEDRINCPRYAAKVVKNVEIKESPEWLKEKT